MSAITIQADERLLSELEAIAEQEQEQATIDEVTLEALDEFVRSRRGSTNTSYSFIGIGHSGQADLSTRAEKILEQDADRREGWSLR